MSKFLILELAMNGNYHAEINQCMCDIISVVFPSDEIFFYCGKEQAKIIAHKHNLKIRILKFFPLPRLNNLLKRDFLGAYYALKNMLKSSKHDKFLFTYVLPLTHWSIRVTNFFLKRKLFIMLHGQLEAFLPDSNLRLTKYYFRSETLLFKWPNTTNYIILGTPIYKNIKNIFKSEYQPIIIDHPYNFESSCARDACDKNYPLIIGQIGVGNIGKGTDLLIELAERLSDLVKSGKVRFKLIGKLDQSLIERATGKIDYYEEPLDNSTFQDKIKELTFALLLRNNNSGRVVASGSFLDAVRFGIPFIGIKNDFIDYYATQYDLEDNLVDTLDQLETLLRKRIQEFNIETYNTMKSKVLFLQNTFNENNVAAKFANQL